MNRKLPTLLAIPLLLLLSAALADGRSHQDFDGYRVYYSAFNSSFITPAVAANYNITRGKNKGLVNIAVVPDGAQGGRTALVAGQVGNILAQQQRLAFFEVREGNAVYYLAPFTFANEDSLTFKISVQPHPDKPARDLVFQRKFYHDK